MWQSYSVSAVMWEILSTVPAIEVRAVLFWYRACIIRV